MKNTFFVFNMIIVLLFVFTGCNNYSNSENSDDQDKNLKIANDFLDAFYSFDRDSLESLLSFADETKTFILYYQEWAKCGNYEVLKRDSCFKKNDSTVICPVTVKDDLIGALEIDFNVTDTFHLIIKKGSIRSITTSSNDPDAYYEAKVWVKENRAELIEIPCKGIWEDGDTPCDCVQAMVKGFKGYVSEKNQNNNP